MARARATRVARTRRRSVEMRAETEICCLESPVTDRKSPCAVDQTAWTRS
jgi:hypothetical protein